MHHLMQNPTFSSADCSGFSLQHQRNTWVWPDMKSRVNIFIYIYKCFHFPKILYENMGLACFSVYLKGAAFFSEMLEKSGWFLQ